MGSLNPIALEKSSVEKQVSRDVLKTSDVDSESAEVVPKEKAEGHKNGAEDEGLRFCTSVFEPLLIESQDRVCQWKMPWRQLMDTSNSSSMSNGNMVVAVCAQVSRLQEQLQAERDLRAALEVGLSMSSGHGSGSNRAMDSKGINKARVMLDFEDSTVTYTEISSPFADLSDIGSPGVDGPPVMPEDPYAYVVATFQAPPSPDYVPGPEEPEQATPSLVYVPYVPEPAYPEFMPSKEVLPAEEQPLPAALLPTANLPGHVLESDPEEDPEDDDDEDPEEDPADYPADGGDNGDDKDESSDDDVDIEEDEEEEEHLVPANSTAVALSTVDHAPSAEETEPFETDESEATPPPHPAYRVTARISIRDEPPTPFWSDTEVARLLAIPTQPPSPLSLWSSPLPQIPSPPLPPILSPLLVSSPPPASPTYPLGCRAALIRLRAKAPSTSHSPPPHIILSYTRADTPPSGTPPLLPIPLPTSLPYLLLPFADHGADIPEVCLPPRKRLCFAFVPRYEVGESSSAAAARPTGGFKADYGFVAIMDREIRRDLEIDVGYGITDTWEEMMVYIPGAPATDNTELGRRMTEVATRVRQNTDEIYVRLDDEQTERQLMAGRLNMLYRVRCAHARTALLLERERERL
ncbi:hypothetical protein Tco_0247133 [Tanacetum coccineum]